jgi:hypothetical protein
MRNTPTYVITLSAALALVSLSQPTRAAKVVLPLVDLEPQYASQLCWAAGDVVAVNSFLAPSIPPNIPAMCQAAANPGRITQAIDAAYNHPALQITDMAGLQARVASDPADVKKILSYCETDIQNCNYPGTPLLLGLTHDTVHDTGLSWMVATQQIDGGHPYLFTWKYSSGGSHQFVAIGYSDNSGQQLIVWDPLPVRDPLPALDDGCGPLDGSTPAGHSTSVDFSVYADPVSDMGMSASHGDDLYKLAVAATTVIPGPPDLTVDGIDIKKKQPQPPQPQPPSPPSGDGAAAQPSPGTSFTVALRDTLPGAERQAHTARLDIGVPFPIVPIGLDQLRRAGSDPTRLLTQVTSAVLFPLESNGKVVDSFLLLFRHGTWERGGYANTEITRLLVQARLKYAEGHHLNPKNFYMVSVPGLAAFFAAYGNGHRAVLIPASSDPLIGAVAGTAIPAATELNRMRDAINRLDARAPLQGSVGR